MLYIIPVYANSIEETIQVEDELGVAKYFFTKDTEASIFQKMSYAVASDFVLNVLLGTMNVSPKSVYLRYIYRKLTEGMYSNFCWGDEKFTRKYFS